MKMRKIVVFVAAMALVIVPAFAFGAVDPETNPFGYLDSATGKSRFDKGGMSVGDIGSVVVNLIDWFAWFIALIAVAMGLYAGFLFMTARGETAQLSTARKTFVWAIIGIAVAIASFSIVAITKIFL